MSKRPFLSALGIAATQAAGVIEILGSMAKNLNVGLAARNALPSALLAANGQDRSTRSRQARLR